MAAVTAAAEEEAMAAEATVDNIISAKEKQATRSGICFSCAY